MEIIFLSLVYKPYPCIFCIMYNSLALELFLNKINIIIKALYRFIQFLCY